ncbi:MAG: hypothetical protein Q4A19_07515 [Johnsonella sp.]|nr:hypothetical protein [Johnsonella sp.]
MKRRLLFPLLGIVFLFFCGFYLNTEAALVNIEGNSYFKQQKIPSGKTGKIINITFSFTADRDYENAWVGLAYDDQINASDEKENPEKYAYPFELSEETTARKSLGKMKTGQTKNVTISARVRRDIPDGYYGIQVYVSDSKDSPRGPQEYINVWIQKSTEAEKETEVKSVNFVLGEEQAAPKGSYPEVMNFSINLRNRGKVTAQEVTASLVMDKDDKVFPFEINEANYDRRFEKIAHDETVSLDYSFAIRKDSYTGYYPIKMKISYKESAGGEIKTEEAEFFVHVVSKSTEESTTEASRDFNPNDRTRARIVVDSYKTIPEEVIAGQDFELVVVMKNASSDIAASNILFALESEKASDSLVFTTESGSNSVVVNSLAPGATTEFSMKMKSKADVPQRSYAITIKEKFDSPEFKNAEDSVIIDIPVKQLARLNIGNIEIIPETIQIGGEANITFPINNTGKVTLYNVMAKFESPSIKTNEAYVGNIKSGESGNVDVMLQGQALSKEGEKIKLTISYEDENGEINTTQKEIELLVSEEMENEFTDFGEMDLMEEENVKKPWYQNNKILIPLLILVFLLAGVILFKKIKAKKEMDEIE